MRSEAFSLAAQKQRRAESSSPPLLFFQPLQLALLSTAELYPLLQLTHKHTQHTNTASFLSTCWNWPLLSASICPANKAIHSASPSLIRLIAQLTQDDPVAVAGGGGGRGGRGGEGGGGGVGGGQWGKPGFKTWCRYYI